MQRTLVAIGTVLILLTASASADDKDTLIALDKQWGEATGKADKTAAAKFLADSVVSVSDEGIRGKQREIADIEAAPAGTRYEPTDYKVTFINPDLAIMTHGTKGTDAHYSLHVWSRTGNTWQVIASSTTPAKKQ